MILERDAEQAVIGGVLAAAGRGSGGLVLAEGPPGIGKTALLRHARDVAGVQGLRVRNATASPLDRDFPFGLVHQLLDPVVAGADDSVFAGTAARARAVLASDEPPDAPSHALLHGLYWLSANLAEAQPLLLLVDDLHWADGPSLRVLSPPQHARPATRSCGCASRRCCSTSPPTSPASTRSARTSCATPPRRRSCSHTRPSRPPTGPRRRRRLRRSRGGRSREAGSRRRRGSRRPPITCS